MSQQWIADIQIPALTRGPISLQENIHLLWEAGQNWCVTGSTASGKTSLLKAIAGLIHVPGAKISFPKLEEKCLASIPRSYVSDSIAFVPQEVKIPAGYIEDLYYQRRFQAAEQDDIPSTGQILKQLSGGKNGVLEKTIEIMQLTSHLHQPFVQLSNGQTRRFMLALALLKEPEILILDNPYAGLDSFARQELNVLLQQLSKNGVHLLMAAHAHEIEGAEFITHRLQLADRNSPVAKSTNPSSHPKKSVANTCWIEMNKVRVQYGDKIVLNNISWQVYSNDWWIIKGRNGSGKSTLLSLLFADHPQAYSNEIYWKGRRRGSGESIWDIKLNIGYFSPELLRYYEKPIEVEAIIASGMNDIIGQLKALSAVEKSGIRKWMQQFSIGHLEGKSFLQLSAGEQRIVLLARAFVKDPPIIILDEPLQGLDLHWRAFLKETISRICRNKTLLYVTHDEAEIPEAEWNVLDLDAIGK